VTVAVCGTSVPGVWEVLDVVLGDELEVVDVVVVEVVVVEFEEDGLLEQAPSARAQAGRISRRIDHVRTALGIAGVYDGPASTWGFPLRSPYCQERAGTVPITDARSMERRCGQ
jgi:hypothetical protein